MSKSIYRHKPFTSSRKRKKKTKQTNELNSCTSMFSSFSFFSWFFWTSVCFFGLEVFARIFLILLISYPICKHLCLCCDWFIAIGKTHIEHIDMRHALMKHQRLLCDHTQVPLSEIINLCGGDLYHRSEQEFGYKTLLHFIVMFCLREVMTPRI